MKPGKTMGAASAAALCLFLLGAAPSIAAETVLVAAPESHDFGQVPEGQTAAVTVSIQNTGSETVEIINMRTS